MRRWRVGNISMAAILIVAGVLLLVSNFTDLNFGKAIAIGWPIIMILLGIEMLLYLYFSKDEKPRIQFDGLSIFFVCLILVGSLIAYGVTAVFQSDVTKVWLEERMDRYQYSVAVSDKIDASDATTLTLDDQSADVKIIPSNQLRVTRNITVRYNDKESCDQLLTLYRDNVKTVSEDGTMTITGGPSSMNYNMTGARLYVEYVVEKPDAVRLNLINYRGLSTLGDAVPNLYTGRYEDGRLTSYEELHNPSYGDSYDPYSSRPEDGNDSPQSDSSYSESSQLESSEPLDVSSLPAES